MNKRRSQQKERERESLCLRERERERRPSGVTNNNNNNKKRARRAGIACRVHMTTVRCSRGVWHCRIPCIKRTPSNRQGTREKAPMRTLLATDRTRPAGAKTCAAPSTSDVHARAVQGKRCSHQEVEARDDDGADPCEGGGDQDDVEYETVTRREV